LIAQTTTVCCYPDDNAYVAATVALLDHSWQQMRSQLDASVPLRVLFSAHGLPETIVLRGDPYQWQIEQTVARVLAQWNQQDLDWRICYQSRATPQQWIGPSTDSEIERAAHDNRLCLGAFRNPGGTRC
jgi:ferrochelatase